VLEEKEDEKMSSRTDSSHSYSLVFIFNLCSLFSFLFEIFVVQRVVWA